jgi:hypothetical protein
LYEVVGIMSEESKSEGIAIDLPRLGRVCVKVVDLLGRRTRSPIEAYLVLKLLCLTFEADLDIQLETEEESKLRRLAAPKVENSEA